MCCRFIYWCNLPQSRQCSYRCRFFWHLKSFQLKFISLKGIGSLNVWSEWSFKLWLYFLSANVFELNWKSSTPGVWRSSQPVDLYFYVFDIWEMSCTVYYAFGVGPSCHVVAPCSCVTRGKDVMWDSSLWWTDPEDRQVSSTEILLSCTVHTSVM